MIGWCGSKALKVDSLAFVEGKCTTKECNNNVASEAPGIITDNV